MAFFQVHLSVSHLRAYLHQLPDFEDFEAEQRALNHVGGHANVHAALSFLVEWPAHERAAQLVLSRNKEIDGDRYELLDPAASLIEGKYPLAAVLLRRALIEVTLRKARATRYKHAARHVREIDSVNSQIRDYENFETHDQFMGGYERPIRGRRDSGRCCAIETGTGCLLSGEQRTPYARIELFRF
jgi:hypothetical protein